MSWILATVALSALVVAPPDPKLQAALDRLEQDVNQGRIAGAVVLVAKRDRVLLHAAVGYADLEAKRPMRLDTRFQVMSMTKPITALATIAAAERGFLRLDDPVARYLPGLNAKPQIRDLMTHTAGFGSIDPGGLDDDRKRKLSLREYADLLSREPLVYPPGTEIRYSGPGYAALGRCVEVATQMPLENWMHTVLWTPAGLKDTSFFARADDDRRLAQVYSEEGGKLVRVDPDPLRHGARFANPAGGLYSTSMDMYRLMRALLAGKLISPAALRAATTVQTGDLLLDGNRGLGYGWGFTVVRDPAGQAALKPIGAFGHTGAYGTEFWAEPKSGLIVVFMAQGWSGVSEARKTFNTMVNSAVQ